MWAHIAGASLVTFYVFLLVAIAMLGFDFEHDIVLSGVNDGANLGDDVLYSGTVAAAVEGRHLGLPAIAVSWAAPSCAACVSAGRTS